MCNRYDYKTLAPSWMRGDTYYERYGGDVVPELIRIVAQVLPALTLAESGASSFKKDRTILEGHTKHPPQSRTQH